MKKNEVKVKPYIISIIIFLVLNYSVYVLFDIDIAVKIIQFIGSEDGIVEYMTFISFLVAFFLFLRTYLINKNIFYLLLAIVFFLGAGEEISWGQRIFNFSTPEVLEEVNVQKEFNIHNIGIFNTYNPDGSGKKTGLSKLLTIGFLYKLFWLGFCIILPIINMSNDKLSKFIKRINLPVPPLSIGIFFLISWIIYKIIVIFFFQPAQPPVYYYMANEMEESISAFIFMMLSVYFYNREKK